MLCRCDGEPEAQLNPKKKVFEKVSAHFKTSPGECQSSGSLLTAQTSHCFVRRGDGHVQGGSLLHSSRRSHVHHSWRHHQLDTFAERCFAMLSGAHGVYLLHSRLYL